ncbi:MAG: molybdate/tungstate transport system ATP-binding protein [Planctomycetota bacterium]|jgi:molybdate/tungstate transport system ATP-binding protein
MIEVDNLCILRGAFALTDLNFSVPAGSYTALMGRTGCGKTSLLESLVGLAAVRSGSIRIAGEDVTTKRPADRGIGYVPQDAVLFPTMTVAENLGFALRVRKRSRSEIDARCEELARSLNLVHLLERNARDLSGGERQRVALGRAMAAEPQVLLLDEPLSALDDESREELSQVLSQLHSESEVTLLHVTHDSRDVVRLAERVLRIEEGHIRVDSGPK